MYKKVLVPYDDSESSQHALKEALTIVAGANDAHVTVLKVVEWHDYNAETFQIASRMSGISDDSVGIDALSQISSEADKEETRRITESIASIVDGANNVEVAIVNGSPHDAIVSYASNGDFDCIIMGHRGMGVIRGMLGSVAYSVLQKSNKPVLVVK